MSGIKLLTLHAELEKSMRRLLDYLFDPPDPGPHRLDRLNHRLVGNIGDRSSPLSLAAGTLLIGLHFDMSSRSTAVVGAPGFLAAQASIAIEYLDKVAATLGQLTPESLTAIVSQVRSAADAVFGLIERDHGISRSRWLDH